ncbi:hypothetical protein KP509_19G015600 [Ceratopteris richardii]|uniref:Leucine-rich repeat-containing N-terminal plant-type domain-containing protein n=1 Tax=Ceratopteris richardii TaxID=49495 RepID=A0A8T2SIB5_CERRI|nr:hypothetical protein KP509_19G015600 [Ceratopteris richardii]
MHHTAFFREGLAVALLALMMMWVARAQLHPNDVAVLKAVRSWLRDVPGGNESFFASWDFNQDPCSFDGVLCDVVNREERVAALNLGLASGSSMGLRGRLHPAIGALPELVQLSLAPGRVSGPIPATLTGLTKLQNLGLSHNLLTGVIPAGLSTLTELTTLDLSFNRVTGSVPAEITMLPRLFLLNLAHNRLAGPLPSFASATALEHLNVERNALVGALPDLPQSLTYLSLARNQLSGPIDSVGSLAALTYLDLSDNRLTGSIPSSIFTSPLSALYLQRNLLSGTVSPPELVTIGTVDLSFNQLGGAISPFFAFVQNLYLNNNQFTGAVPREFIQQLLSSGIQTLFLQHNFLTFFPLSPEQALPLTTSLCIEYNCMMLPIESPCPLNAGTEKIRPRSQCSSP